MFETSIRALRRLNRLGYGDGGAGLALNLVYNPSGPSLPPPQEPWSRTTSGCSERYGVRFNSLLTLTNMPIRRFGSMLQSTGRFDEYLGLLKSAHCRRNLAGVMCRSLVSVDWQGHVYDCDFNQMLDLPLDGGRRVHIAELSTEDLEGRTIRIGDHCYGCTAGQGSSCGGALS